MSDELNNNMCCRHRVHPSDDGTAQAATSRRREARPRLKIHLRDDAANDLVAVGRDRRHILYLRWIYGQRHTLELPQHNILGRHHACARPRPVMSLQPATRVSFGSLCTVLQDGDYSEVHCLHRFHAVEWTVHMLMLMLSPEGARAKR